MTTPPWPRQGARQALTVCAFLYLLSCSVPKEFVRFADDSIALTHVRVIDGTGERAREDQTILIEKGTIKEIGDAGKVASAGSRRIVDLHGYTALPGLVGMHDHLFYAVPPGSPFKEALKTFPRLYLANGVTTVRTAGTVDMEAELLFKLQVDHGGEPGPHLYLSTPYVDPAPNTAPDPDALARSVSKWFPLGVKSVKVYTHARLSELAAVIEVAHRQGATVTGHLCAVGFSEAAALGIDNLEHGLIVDTEFFSHRKPGVCPDQSAVVAELVKMDVRGPQIQALIKMLVQHHVAITSTLAVFESFAGNRFPKLDPRALPMLVPLYQVEYKAYLGREAKDAKVPWERMLKKEMEFEREFVKAGGLLLAGADPTGWGGVIAGFSDQRGVELLVEAGFAPEEAIRIATANGARFLGIGDQTGALLPGRHADIVLVRGNPAAAIRDIENTEIVFKDGVGYDSGALLRSVAGQVGR